MFKIFSKFKEGLSRTSNRISQTIADIFTKKKLDLEALEKLEELLITADIGLEATSEIIEDLRRTRLDKEITEEEVKEYLANYVENIIAKSQDELKISKELEIILVCGVNGNGKTTTIAKLANFYKNKYGKKILLAACDSFRAAASEQLKIWSDRLEVEIVIGEFESDPASIAYRSIEKAKRENYDIVLIDTAGRLQNKTNLMQELDKINRVIKKIVPEAPHQIILTLDATTGNNALSQFEEFNKLLNLTGIIVTKLDGTAKAGIVVALSKKTEVKILAVGVGEKMEDLKQFEAKDFARNLLGI